MAEAKICAVDGCVKPRIARGWCQAHWARWKRHGSPLVGGPLGASKGESLRWLSARTGHVGDECLPWPFGRTGSGYGALEIDGRAISAHRWMCAEVYGPPPTPSHEAAHSCGRGHLGCVNPGHIRWATHSDNLADRLDHGTATIGEANGFAKLTEADVREIRSGAGRVTQRDLAERYGVDPSNISQIQLRKSWSWLD